MLVGVEGIPGAGKTLWLAKTITDTLWRNRKWHTKTGVIRQIACNMPLSQQILDEYPGFVKQKLGARPGVGWEDLEDLLLLKECDVFWDEIANHLDAQGWTNLGADVKGFLRQHEKRGVDIYFTSQSYGQVDISARRLVSGLAYITKVAGSPRPSATKPEIKRVWGITAMLSEDPVTFDEKKRTFTSVIPHFLWIGRKLTETFDTTYEVSTDNRIRKKHVIEYCSDPTCELHSGRLKHI